MAILTFSNIKKDKVETAPEELTGIDFIKEHPFRSLVQPISKTFGFPTVRDLYEKNIAPRVLRANHPLGIIPQSITGAIASTEADILDIGQTPLTYIPLPIGRLLGKIPFKGTTLGRIAKTVPVGKGFGKGVSQLGKLNQALKNLPSRVAASRSVLQSNPVEKVIDAITGAKPIRGKQEALVSAARGRQAAELVKAGKEVTGEAGFFKQLGKLKGKLPKAEFEGIRGKLGQADIDDLFNMVESNQALSPFDKVNTKKGLSKLFGLEGGGVPTKGELDLLNQVFPKELTEAVLAKQPFLKKFGQGVAEVANIPRAIMASFDLSAPFRQGLFLINKPKRFIKAFGNMFRYAFNEKAYQGSLKNIKSRPTYGLMQQHKLPLTELGGALSGREEAFMSQLPEKIPAFGKIIRGSNRAYTGFLNKLRADVFDDLIKSAQSLGHNVEGRVGKDIARFIGAATGRGTLPKSIEGAAVALNSVFFSPRLMASRLQLLNPVFYTKLDPFVRKEALKSLLTLGSTAATVMGLAKLGGAEVGSDPRNADFAKIKIGNLIAY